MFIMKDTETRPRYGIAECEGAVGDEHRRLDDVLRRIIAGPRNRRRDRVLHRHCLDVWARISDHTAKDLMALPTSREAIVTAKL